MRVMRSGIVAVLFAGVLASGASAAAIGNLEDFDTSSANWFNATSTSAVDWFSTGGPDGGAFASTTFNFTSSVSGDTPVLLRAQDEFNSSSGLFEGDYVAAGVTELRFWLRHDGPSPVNVFARLSTSFNFPGAIVLDFTPILTGAWTEIILSLDPSNPLLILEASDYDAVFTSVGHLQIGVSVGDGLAGFEQDVRFDLDKVQLTPAPGAATALLLGGIMSAARRRRE